MNLSKALCLVSAALAGCAAGRPPAAGPGGGAPDTASPVIVMGEVRRPGVYPPRPGANFVEFLLSARGFTEFADLDRVELLRRGRSGWSAHRYSWRDLREAASPRASDIVIVHSIRASTTEKALQATAHAMSLFTSLNALSFAAAGEGAVPGLAGPGRPPTPGGDSNLPPPPTSEPAPAPSSPPPPSSEPAPSDDSLLPLPLP